MSYYHSPPSQSTGGRCTRTHTQELLSVLRVETRSIIDVSAHHVCRDAEPIFQRVFCSKRVKEGELFHEIGHCKGCGIVAYT